MVEIYNAGTVAAVQGSKTLALTGGAWTENVVRAGDLLIIDGGGHVSFVDAVTNSTALEMTTAFDAADASGLSYEILHASYEWGQNRTVNERVAAYIEALENPVTFLNGNGVPSAGLGDNQNLYIDDATGDLYRKADDAWALIGNMKGPKGDKGDKGDVGDKGLQGIQGEQGLQGVQGEQGAKGDKGDQGDPGTDGADGLNGLLSAAQHIKTADYTVVAADKGKTLIADKATPISFNFEPAATLTNDYLVIIKNEGAGTLTINPDGAETIDDELSIDLPQGGSLLVYSNGANLRTALAGGGGGGGSTDSLVAIAQTKVVTAVDVFIYDTSKDSDGGAWRKRCQGTSWFNEPLNTATRGARKDFPAVAVIVAEADKVTIYDGDDPTLPMWMVFIGNLNFAVRGNTVMCRMLNGVLVCASGNASGAGYQQIDFVQDATFLQSQPRYERGFVTVADRNENGSFISIGGASLNDVTVNAIALKSIDDGGLVPETGLPALLIGASTNAGVSLVKGDEAAIDLTHTVVGTNESGHVYFTEQDGVAWSSRASGGGYVYTQVLNSIPTADFSGAPDAIYANFTQGVYADLLTLGTSEPTEVLENALGSSWGLTLVAPLLLSPANGMVAYITSDYATGWMVGDIKGVFLASTDSSDLVATNFINDRSVNDNDLILGDAATVQQVASGADLVSFIFGSTETVTLSVDISASGMLYWWEKVLGGWHFYVDDLAGGTDFDNGKSGTPSSSVSVSGTTLTLSASKELSLVRATATILSADQIKKIYEDEKMLFQENAACTLYGGADAITALSADPVTDLLHVGTSAGRSVFQGLRRIDNTTTPVTAAISVYDNLVVEA